MVRRAAALVSLAVMLAGLGPGSATAATSTNSPLSPGLPAIPAPATTPTTSAALPVTTTPSSGGGVSGTDAIAIAIGAFALLAGISFFIWYDARRRVPKRSRQVAAAGTSTRPATKKPIPKSRKPSPAERRRRKRGRAR